MNANFGSSIELVNVTGLSKSLGCSKRRVQQLVQRGEIPVELHYWTERGPVALWLKKTADTIVALHRVSRTIKT